MNGAKYPLTRASAKQIGGIFQLQGFVLTVQFTIFAILKSVFQEQTQREVKMKSCHFVSQACRKKVIKTTMMTVINGLGVWAPEGFNQAQIGSYAAHAAWRMVNVFVTAVGATCEDAFNRA